jgi:hypothetical protein
VSSLAIVAVVGRYFTAVQLLTARPFLESLTVHGKLGRNAADAAVRDAVFRGDRVRFTLRAEDGLTLVADAVAAPGLPAPGSRVPAGRVGHRYLGRM